MVRILYAVEMEHFSKKKLIVKGLDSLMLVKKLQKLSGKFGCYINVINKYVRYTI